MLFLLAILLQTAAWACPEGGKAHVNPDGTLGGIVSKNARVSSGAFVGVDAKVCDFAKVASHSRIEGNAIVRGLAKIGEYTTVSNWAQVYDHAEVSGTIKFKTKISEYAKIGGNSVVLQGTLIRDYVRILGSPKIINSLISGSSTVCKDYQIKNEDINNSNYFCPEETRAPSRSKVQFAGIHKEQINLPKDSFKILITPGEFDLNKEFVFLLINGVPVLLSDLYLEEKFIEVSSTSYFRNGENSIQLITRDSLGREVNMPETKVFISKSTLDINVFPRLSSNAAILALAKINGSFTKVEVRKIKDRLIFPDISEFSTSLKLFIGSESNIFGDLFDANSIPPSIVLIKVPPSQGFDNLDFSQGVEGWLASDPLAVSVEEDESGTYLKVFSSSLGPVVVARNFTLNQSQRSIRLNFSVNTIADLSGNILSDGLDSFHYSKASNKIYLTDFSPGILESNSSSQNFNRQINNLSDSFSTRIENEEVITGIVVYKNNDKNILESNTELNLKAELPAFTTQFRLLNHNIYNVQSTENYPNVLASHGCGSNYFITSTSNPNESQLSLEFEDKLKFISVGKILTPFEPAFQNRIYGDLRIEGIKRKEISKIEFEIKQNGNTKFTSALGVCWKTELEDPFQGENEVNFLHVASLAHYLFQLDANVLTLIDPLERVIISPKITFKNGSVTRVNHFSWTLEDNNIQKQEPLIPLAWLNLESDDFEFDSIDYYNNSEAGLSRIGGDKWMLPRLVVPTHSLINSFWDWIINDATKANGGNFNMPHGSTHVDGTDLDITFRNIYDVRLNLDEPRLINGPIINLKEAQWRLGQVIRNSLNVLGDTANFIRDIYITVSRTYLTKDSVVKPNYQFILDRFHASCIGNRFVDLVNPEKGRFSLLRNVPKHSDHLHVKFNYPDINGGSGRITPIPPLTSSLEDLLFEVKKGKLDISSKYSDVEIIWKVSDSPNFSQTTKVFDFGSSKGSKINKNIDMPSYLNLNEFKGYFVDIVYADTKNGGCFHRQITFNSKQICPSGKFSYKSPGKLGSPLFVGENSQVSPYVIQNGAGSVCGNSNLDGDIEFYGRVENVVANVTVPATLSLGGDLKGVPSINLRPTHDSSLSGEFVGEVRSVTFNDFYAKGKGELGFRDQLYSWNGKYINTYLDGELELKDIGAFSGYLARIEGSHTFSDYYTVDFDSSSDEIKGVGTYKGYGKDDPYNNLVFKGFKLNGYANITGSALIERGGEYTSLTLHAPNVNDTYMWIETGGGNVSISGNKSRVVINSKNFSMHHQCDNDVVVLIGDAPDGVNLNPEADNRRNYSCSYASGSRVCDTLKYPCFEPEKTSKN